MDIDEALGTLRRRAEELRRELEAIETVIAYLESIKEEKMIQEIVVTHGIEGIKVVLSKPVKLDELRMEYLTTRLNEIAGGSYSVIRDRGGRVKGVLLPVDTSDKIILEVKALLKTVSDLG